MAMNKLLVGAFVLTLLLFVFVYARLLGVALFILLIDLVVLVIYIQDRRIKNCENKILR